MILSPRTTTAGLNVPAASHPVPRGAITGVSDTRCHAPNGKGRLPCAAITASNASSVNILLGMKRTMCITLCITGVEAGNPCWQQKTAGPTPCRFAILHSCFGLLLVDRLLEIGPRGKFRDAAGGDLDSGASLRVAPVPRFSLRHREGAEAYQSHPISFAEGRRDAVDSGINGSRGLRLADFTRA